MYNSFMQFCDDTAMVKDKIIVGRDATFDDGEVFRLFVENMKKQVSRFDKISMSYIQGTFSSPGELVTKISAKYPDGEIPNGLLNTLSKELYGKAYVDASDLECKIINVLSIYYTISNN